VLVFQLSVVSFVQPPHLIDISIMKENKKVNKKLELFSIFEKF